MQLTEYIVHKVCQNPKTIRNV